MGAPTGFRPRRIVTGHDGTGRSTIVSDGVVGATLERPGGATITEIWRCDQLPATFDDAAPIIADSVIAPAAAGVAVRVCTFPPDSQIDTAARASYAASLAETYGPEAATRDAAAAPGMHRTDTVDVVTVVAGELCVITETGETALGPGDSVVLRGTAHTWSNRTDAPTTVLATMMGASGARPTAHPETSRQEQGS